jgi:biopolymer transport protein ExbD
MRKYSRRRRVLSIPEISLTPLIDTALTLLIIFMVTAPMMNNSIKIELPKGAAKEDTHTLQELIISINKNGQLFFNGIPTTSDMLIGQIQKNIGKNKERTVFVKADQTAQYGKVIETLDKIKVIGGVQDVVLATQKSS